MISPSLKISAAELLSRPYKGKMQLADYPLHFWDRLWMRLNFTLRQLSAHECSTHEPQRRFHWDGILADLRIENRGAMSTVDRFGLQQQLGATSGQFLKPLTSESSTTS
jgi:hypothetical protein